MRYARAFLSWARYAAGATLFGFGCALLVWLLVLFALAALLAVLATLTLAIVPGLLIAAGVKLWPGGMRVTDADGKAASFMEAVAAGIRKARQRRAPGADPEFYRRES